MKLGNFTLRGNDGDISVKVCSCCFLILTAVWLGTPTPAAGSTVYGTTLSIGDYANTGLGSASTTQTDSSATASTVLAGSGTTPACTDPNNCATTSYSVSNQVGQINLSFNTSASCTYGGILCGPNASGLYHYAEAEFNAGVNSSSDGIQVGTIPGGSGLLEVQYLIQGTIGAGGGFANGALSVFLGDLNDPNTVAFSVNFTDCTIPALCGTDLSYSPTISSSLLANGSTMLSTLTPDGSLAGTWDYSVYETLVIPVSSGLQDALSMDVIGSSDNVAGPAYTPANWFSLTDDPQLGGAQFYNAAGTSLLAGVSLTSNSGFDYTQPLSSSTPEPATFGMIAIGLIGLASRLRKRIIT